MSEANMQLDEVRQSNAKHLAVPEGWAEFTLRLCGNVPETDCGPDDFLGWLAEASPRIHQQAQSLAMHLSAFPWRIAVAPPELQTNANVLVVRVTTSERIHLVHVRRMPALGLARIDVESVQQ
jgi:hypothetical protein